MDGELHSLEAKLSALLKLHAQLRQENNGLRQQLASRNDECARLQARLGDARERVERLLRAIPPDKSAA
jgi:uncharacterized protein (TIGR02449 family)